MLPADSSQECLLPIDSFDSKPDNETSPPKCRVCKRGVYTYTCSNGIRSVECTVGLYSNLCSCTDKRRYVHAVCFERFVKRHKNNLKKEDKGRIRCGKCKQPYKCKVNLTFPQWLRNRYDDSPLFRLHLAMLALSTGVFLLVILPMIVGLTFFHEGTSRCCANWMIIINASMYNAFVFIPAVLAVIICFFSRNLVKLIRPSVDYTERQLATVPEPFCRICKKDRYYYEGCMAALLSGICECSGPADANVHHACLDRYIRQQLKGLPADKWPYLVCDVCKSPLNCILFRDVKLRLRYSVWARSWITVGVLVAAILTVGIIGLVGLSDGCPNNDSGKCGNLAMSSVLLFASGIGLLVFFTFAGTLFSDILFEPDVFAVNDKVKQV